MIQEQKSVEIGAWLAHIPSGKMRLIGIFFAAVVTFYVPIILFSFFGSHRNMLSAWQLHPIFIILLFLLNFSAFWSKNPLKVALCVSGILITLWGIQTGAFMVPLSLWGKILTIHWATIILSFLWPTMNFLIFDRFVKYVNQFN